MECWYNFVKLETLITTCNINNGKMNIIGLTGHINRVKLQRIILIGISECGFINEVVALTGFS